MVIDFKKRMVIFDIPFILICNWIKQADIVNQRTNGPVNAHLISWPSKAQNLEKYMVKK